LAGFRLWSRNPQSVSAPCADSSLSLVWCMATLYDLSTVHLAPPAESPTTSRQLTLASDYGFTVRSSCRTDAAMAGRKLPPRNLRSGRTITSGAAKQRSPGLCRDKAEARRRNHLSDTMIPPATGCSPLCYCEAPKIIGLTMVSILAAISSAGTRFGD